MEASLSPSPALSSPLPTTHSRHIDKKYAKSTPRFSRTKRSHNRLMTTRVAAVTTPPDPGQVEITWQIMVGAIAGVIPFIVAGIEFSKRIVAQRRCEVCGGSGLVLRDGEYFRCPGCGGFLPWQSWKRFFSG